MTTPTYLGPKTANIALFAASLSHLEKHFHLNNQSKNYNTLRLMHRGDMTKLDMSTTAESPTEGALCVFFDISVLTLKSWFSHPDKLSKEDIKSAYSAVLMGMGADKVEIEYGSFADVFIRVYISTFRPELLSHILDCVEVPRRVNPYAV